MAAAPPANLSFLPWVRQGAAGAITTVDTLGARQAGVAGVAITLTVNQAPLAPVSVRLRGPADVVGIDAHQVVRTDPRPGTNDFEPNCFASIEFDRADFPWLFTPARANPSGQLRPWLCLVVVRRQAGVALASTVDAPLPTLSIAAPALPFVELPDLAECWAWAHAQVAAAGAQDAAAVGAALDGAPSLSLSRLVCPRLLAPDTDYLACVVPTFELGRRAGLGLPVADADLTAASALAPSWTSTATAPAQVVLPVYYSWAFRTGPAGDFESLARQLTIGAGTGLGSRKVVIGRPGFALPPDVPPATTVALEGALAPLAGTGDPVPWADAAAPSFEKALAPVVNAPGASQVTSPDSDPLLAPPLYGRWHAARATVSPAAANWFDELNLDPRWRAVAALGTRVVQAQQEALVASAWEQAAAMQQANQRLRHLQLSLAVGESLHARHLSVFTEEMSLRIAAPVFGRIRAPAPAPATPGAPPPGRTLYAQVAASSLPVAATTPAMRRIGRQRGPLSRRIVAQGFARSAAHTWVASMNIGNVRPPVAPPPPSQAGVPSLPTAAAVINAAWNHGFRVVADGAPLPPLPVFDPLPPDWDYPGLFRAAAAEHLQRLRPRVIAGPPPHTTMTSTLGLVLAQMHPRVALANLARAAVSTGDNVLPPTAPGIAPLGIETVMMAPSFPQPMYEPLKQISQDLLLPGLEAVLPNTVVGLRTNRAFVESYMIGLNFEMARELLWRGFPTDQQGTYFRNFWSHDAPGAGAADIADLRTSLGRALGAAPPGAPAEEFVLLLRTSLIARYPNALIYLTPALASSTGTPPPDIWPIFSGGLQPDIAFFGFPVSPATAIGSAQDPGYYVVIQEHPTEPRFGLDAGTPAGAASHLAIGTAPPPGVALKGRTWGKNAAHMADITRRVPVRIAIHASQLVSAT